MEIISLDARDLVYLVAGIGFLLLTVLATRRHGFAVAPILYVIAGALLTFTPLAIPFIDPLGTGTELKIVEHASELIVIISLAGAGLSIDKRMDWKNWSPAWRLLAIAMPLTILGIAWGGMTLAALPLASAVLLAASLAPTDPVLARSVQVHGPMQGGEDDVRLGLTAEAGLNDGLAFPFVYLAIALTAPELVEAGTAVLDGFWRDDWFRHWASYDLVYRVGMGVAIGVASGWALAWVIHELGDASDESHDRGENAGLTVLAATFIAYGLAEAVSAYGFLAVFVAARAGRRYTERDKELTAYNRHPHLFSVQFESILLCLLLLWFGAFLTSGLMNDLTGGEIALAILIVFVLRPVAGWLALLGHRAQPIERAALAFFGVRGMGTVFYVAYGQSHAAFPDVAGVWRVAAVTILISIAVHGIGSAIVMPRLGAARRDGPRSVDETGGIAGQDPVPARD